MLSRIDYKQGVTPERLEREESYDQICLLERRFIM